MPRSRDNRCRFRGNAAASRNHAGRSRGNIPRRANQGDPAEILFFLFIFLPTERKMQNHRIDFLDEFKKTYTLTWLLSHGLANLLGRGRHGKIKTDEEKGDTTKRDKNNRCLCDERDDEDVE